MRADSLIDDRRKEIFERSSFALAEVFVENPRRCLADRINWSRPKEMISFLWKTQHAA